MKSKSTIVVIAIIVIVLSVRYFNHSHSAPDNKISDGDIIFQTHQSGQSKAIQLATHSPYSHCGIIFRDKDEFYVYEGVQPVKRTRLDKFVSRGEGGHYEIKRLKNAGQIITPASVSKMKDIFREFKGKDYDLTFEWTDDKIYCSELVWKIYKRSTGLEVGKLQHLEDFDLSSEIVKKKLTERYGENIPLNETVISPASIFDSELLLTVKSE